MNADAEKYLGYLVERIHTTVLSTNGEDGYPHTCAVDMMSSMMVGSISSQRWGRTCTAG